jgi:mRNA interferase MazF
MASTKGGTPSRRDVYMVGLDPTVGHEQAGQRPALIVSDEPLNRSPSAPVIIAPITGTDRGVPAHVPVVPPEGGLMKASVIMVDQIRTISRRRLVRRLGAITPATMAEVDKRLRLVLGLS